MRDGDDRALVLGQVLLEPGHGLGVEMVGGLVEQQQVGCAQQQSAESDPAALAAGEDADVRVRRRQPQRVHRVFELGVEVPRVRGVDLGLDLAELLGGLIGVVGSQLVEAVEQRLRLRDAVLDVPPHVLGLVELWLLLEHPDARPGASAASPRYSWSIPAMILSSVDFPEPLYPRTPIFAPG